MCVLYNNGNKYYGFKSLEDDIAELKDEDNCFDIDDEIMLYPLVELNNKGYITEFCCSSHPYNVPIIIDSIDSNLEDYEYNKELIKIKKVFTQKRNFAILENNRDEEIYIKFKNGIILNSCPIGWNLNKDKNKISKTIENETNKWKQYKKVVKEIDILMNWINIIPNINEMYM